MRSVSKNVASTSPARRHRPVDSRKAVYSEVIACLQKAGSYTSVGVDLDGRVVVVVDDSQIDFLRAQLFSQVWGSEWPTVRSEKWIDAKKDYEQLQFNSRG